ncbi:RAB6A [Mytilus coruscus]|uniref:RAB6A n=1 Tax=Mytilus coruscus TaxID=42192 RepID=A0A6J8AF72_MYTCO|nr:RAB6A [Mytilus coruscus]
MAEKANVLLLGDHNVGKSSLVNYQRIGKFCDKVYKTEELGLNTFILPIKDKRYKIIVKDSPGLRHDHRNESFVIPEFKKSPVIVFIYDKTYRGSFDRILDIKQMVDDHVNRHNGYTYILVGNKSDDKNNVKVTTEEGQSRCTKSEMDFFIETSAKEGTHVAELFNEVSSAVNDDREFVRFATQGYAVLAAFEVLNINSADELNVHIENLKTNEQKKTFLEKLSSDIVKRFVATETFKFTHEGEAENNTNNRTSCGFPGCPKTFSIDGRCRQRHRETCQYQNLEILGDVGQIESIHEEKETHTKTTKLEDKKFNYSCCLLRKG